MLIWFFYNIKINNKISQRKSYRQIFIINIYKNTITDD